MQIIVRSFEWSFDFCCDPVIVRLGCVQVDRVRLQSSSFLTDMTNVDYLLPSCRESWLKEKMYDLQNTATLTLIVQTYLFAVIVTGLLRRSTICHSITRVTCFELRAFATLAIGLWAMCKLSTIVCEYLRHWRSVRERCVEWCRSLWNPNAGRYENYKRCDDLRPEDNNIDFADNF